MEKTVFSLEKWLEKFNLLISGPNPDLKKAALELNQIIIEQRNTMEKFFKTIHDSSPSGFTQATVLRFKKILVTGYKEQSYGDFKLGDKVSIDPKSPFVGSPGYGEGVGKIIEFDPKDFKGWALLEFDNEKKKPLRYGNPDLDGGLSDLILLEKSLVDDVETDVVTIFYKGETIDVLNFLEIKLEPGDTVLLHPKTNLIIGKTEAIGRGTVGHVEETSGEKAIVTINGTKYVVIIPERLKECKEGDRVLVDEGVNVILQILPKSKSVAIIADIEPVEWEDVIGLEDAKAEAMEVINFVMFPEIYKAYHSKEPKGILLIGPPGNGKTHFGRALATKISKALGATDGVVKGFMYIKSTEILDMYVGEAPRKVREVFAKAEEYFRETGQKALIFIDEIEAVLKKRGESKNNDSSDAITNAFLTEMDGIQKSYGFVIGATNRPDLIDDAATRAGRLDRVIYVGRPKDADVPKFFTLYLKSTLINKEWTLQHLIDFATEKYLSADYSFFSLSYAKEGIDPNDEKIPKEDRLDKQYFKLSNVGSGAMIETIVNRAKLKAIDRDIKGGGKELSGVTLEDVKKAVEDAFETSKLINLEEAISDFNKQKKISPIEIISLI